MTTSGHLSTGSGPDSPLHHAVNQSAGPPTGTHKASVLGSPGLLLQPRPVWSSVLAQGEAAGQQDDKEILLATCAHVPGPSPRCCRSSIANSFHRDPAPGKAVTALLYLLEELFVPVMPNDRHAGKTKLHGSSQCYQVPKQSFIKKKNLCSRRGAWGHVVGGVAGLSHDVDARG